MMNQIEKSVKFFKFCFENAHTRALDNFFQKTKFTIKNFEIEIFGFFFRFFVYADYQNQTNVIT